MKDVYEFGSEGPVATINGQKLSESESHPPRSLLDLSQERSDDYKIAESYDVFLRDQLAMSEKIHTDQAVIEDAVQNLQHSDSLVQVLRASLCTTFKREHGSRTILVNLGGDEYVRETNSTVNRTFASLVEKIPKGVKLPFLGHLYHQSIKLNGYGDFMDTVDNIEEDESHTGSDTKSADVTTYDKPNGTATDHHIDLDYDARELDGDADFSDRMYTLGTDFPDEGRASIITYRPYGDQIICKLVLPDGSTGTVRYKEPESSDDPFGVFCRIAGPGLKAVEMLEESTVPVKWSDGEWRIVFEHELESNDDEQIGETTVDDGGLDLSLTDAFHWVGSIGLFVFLLPGFILFSILLEDSSNDTPVWKDFVDSIHTRGEAGEDDDMFTMFFGNCVLVALYVIVWVALKIWAWL